MMDKPLHVRVAEALGWRLPHEDGRCDHCGWPLVKEREDGCILTNCSMRPMPPIAEPPRYDTDWSATGPLIERYGISVRLSPHPWDPKKPWAAWAGPSDVPFDAIVSHQATPLEAVCNLILALAKERKLQ